MCSLSPGPPAAASQASCSFAHLLHNLAPLLVRQPLPHLEYSLPGCPSPPLLLVWMNVSSLSPRLSDFHTVQFSVSSGCFLLLNCCPSFGCARRHSVSTYASILTGSPAGHLYLLKQLNCPSKENLGMTDSGVQRGWPGATSIHPNCFIFTFFKNFFVLKYF